MTVSVRVGGVDARRLDGELEARARRVFDVKVPVPASSVNEPRTLVTMAWRATKPIRLWAGSSR